MASFVEDLWSSIFTAGPTPTLLLATNVSFAALQTLLLVLLLATSSIHFIFLSIISGALWYSINWFAQELNRTQAQTAGQDHPEASPGEATQTEAKARGTPDVADSDTETEGLVDRKSAQAPSQPASASTTLQVPGTASEVRKRLSVSGESSGYASTDSEWEKVDDNSGNWALSIPLDHYALDGEVLQPGINLNLHNPHLAGLLNAPSLFGELGEMQHQASSLTDTWKWMISQLQSYPRAFARDAETLFIHKNLCPDPSLRKTRATLGVCALNACLSEENQPVLFQILDAEVVDLLQRPLNTTLAEDLFSLQTMVLFQIIRLFHGHPRQQAIADQQATPLKAWALKLLQRADTELPDPGLTWEDWILKESTRRTVMLAFMLYAADSVQRHGVCLELPTLGVLPVSTNFAFWHSRSLYLENIGREKTLKYGDFTTVWLASPPRKLDEFERLLLTACKGLEQVNAHSLNAP
ncbi:ER protein Pkr1-domain-containing protein [Aspergillus crustosus]